MEKNLAIRGDSNRGDEVISFLKMLGGLNYQDLSGDGPFTFYYINRNKLIDSIPETLMRLTDWYYHTIDSITDTYPYKVGDVINTERQSFITGMVWDPKVFEIKYKISDAEMDEVRVDQIKDDTYLRRVNCENILGKPKYKNIAIRGDRYKSACILDVLQNMGGTNFHSLYFGDEECFYYIDNEGNIQNVRADECANEFATFNIGEFYNKFPYSIGDRVYLKTGENYVIRNMSWNGIEVEYTCVDLACNPFTVTMDMIKDTDKEDKLDITHEYTTENKVETTGYMQMGKIIAVIFNDANYEDEVELQLGDYEIEVRDGKTFAVKKKPLYPTTYEECYDEDNTDLHFIYVDKDERDLYESFIQLIRCRNAYMKIAGEQMGLDIPWEPDEEDEIFIIGYNRISGIYKSKGICTDNFILSFPTEEMRDAFYENFKDLIESCKELL